MVEFKLKHSFIKGSEYSREFQTEMIEFMNSKDQAAILNAPTGSGKTYGFKNMINNKDSIMLILLPNNLLSEEVYNNFKEDDDVSLVNSKTVNNKFEEMKKEGLEYVTKEKAINALIEYKKILISNPEMFYYMMINKYMKSDRDDEISVFLRSGLRLIIIDEVHIYSRDQIYILLGFLKLINKNLKLLFSSATIPNSLKDLIEKTFDGVRNINAVRVYKKNENNVILQGPINLKIEFSEITEYIKDSISELKSGNWFIIADSIRNVINIYNELIKYIDKNEIAIITAYHDPSYDEYKKLFSDNSKRICIGSNIIEQGINPPKRFNNFIIEPGFDVKNFMQRAGRIGRNTNDESTLVVILNEDFNIHNISTIEDLYNLIEKIKPEKNNLYLPEYIGVYSAIIMQNLSRNFIKGVKNNIFNEKFNPLEKYTGSFYRTAELFKKFDDIKSDRKKLRIIKSDVNEIEDIINWWYDIFIESFQSFLNNADKVKGKDINEKFNFEYDKIWINKNKKIISYVNNEIITNGLNLKPNYDFIINVKGMPFSCDYYQFKFKDLNQYNARKKFINEGIECLDRYIINNDETKELMASLKDVIYATAGYERLIIDVGD